MKNRKIINLYDKLGTSIETSEKKYSFWENDPTSQITRFFGKHPIIKNIAFAGLSLYLTTAIATHSNGLKNFYKDSKQALGLNKPVIQKIEKSKKVIPKEKPKEKTLEQKTISNNITSDEFFTNKDYLTKEQIQHIFDEYDSCLKDTNIAEIISKTAKENNINPIYLIATLQREQGLVSKKSATKKELDYAMGYGCPDKGEWIKSKGLEFQIKKAAKCYKKHFNRFQLGETIEINYGTKIEPIENATESAILHYTPHDQGKNLLITLVKQYNRIINNH